MALDDFGPTDNSDTPAPTRSSLRRPPNGGEWAVPALPADPQPRDVLPTEVGVTVPGAELHAAQEAVNEMLDEANPSTEGKPMFDPAAIDEVLRGPQELFAPLKATEIVSPLSRKLEPQEASHKYLKLAEDFSQLNQTVELLSQKLGEKDATIIALHESVAELKVRMDTVRLQCIDNRPVPLRTFQQIAGAIIRIGTVTLLGAVVGAPVLAWATPVILKEAALEGAASGFIAGVSTEVANRVADPTSHRHGS